MKRQTKINKDICIIILLFVIFLIAVYFTSDQSSTKQPDYTILSPSDKGVSLLFDTYKNMGIPVEMYQKSIEYADIANIQIIIQPNSEFETIEEFNKITEFVNMGGNVICLINNSIFFPYSLIIDEDFELLQHYTKSGLAVYTHGKGQIIHAQSDLFTNKNLFSNRQAGLELLELISDCEWDYYKIYFNEYYHGYGQKTNLWVALPIWAKQTVFLIVLLMVLVVIYLGKRFGKPKPYYEEIERYENEYVIAVGRLYYNALLYKKIADNYFYDFIFKCCVHFKIDTGLDISGKINVIRNNWQEYDFSDNTILESVLAYEKIYKTDTNASITKSEYKSLISSIERLNTIIKEGRDYKWR